MTILITGGAGYIGSHTTAALLENGYDNIVVIDNLCNSDIGSIKSVERITGKKISFFNADIRDEIELNKIFTRCNISSVIHFAGLKSVAESKDLPIEYYSNNVYGTMNLVKCMLKNRVYNLIFSSSATVYGIPEKNPLDENCITGGTTNPYGYSKYISE
ncbi:TPA: SDR family NAD(P)-dependent oxidoreductase, partial [Escherichia coli]|nr:SDR family NAD(P)-dependent oxidoreductase [Escherichia coli]